ncbi:pyridoxamine 5'-phosphate oxidase [Halieaceae bacterium IMCC14734]|uniref:Pyridoxamine 5'-phosphate oxidase n=1 Tax=Candidatus Litorirhabdus singularis TaxID=2518993 RepID=A0ABT3TKQ0_9GAMM|nr:pyridoxamine 5'-phosphate oxidase family protein [Candidatus Litorirhabdus singularis]MCX2982863.1 pyridoxamine 5'-phosphate oxidase [Candidatus Litorirhabdus singularis]
MAHKFAEIAFTPVVRAIQTQQGSRGGYARMDGGDDYNHQLSGREAMFIAARDSFYMSSVSESGWPYLQHRGGPAGFMKVLDERTIGFADFAGNRQYVSTGNFSTNNRVALFFMDYPNRTRLKLLGRVRTIGLDEPELLARLEDADYPAQIERGFVIEVEAFDWNCPQHITPRFTQAEVEHELTELRAENQHLQDLLAGSVERQPAATQPNPPPTSEVLGEGPLELIVSGVRQLAPKVRAFELRDPKGGELPPVEAGSHLRVPVRLPSGAVVDRHYSIASNPQRTDIYEIAVLREEAGSGGSAAVHDSYSIGTRLRVDLPANHFGLHEDKRPALLIAGGIGITPIKAMAQALAARDSKFHLHYAGRSRLAMPFRDRLQRQLADRLTVYSSDDGQRMDVAALLVAAADDTVIYVCGPHSLISAVTAAAKALGIARERVRLELFA